MPPSAPADALIEASTMRRVTLRIVPFLMVCYFIAFVDRVNAGFAALQMNKDVGLSAAVFGLGGGLFFVAYVLCEVPGLPAPGMPSTSASSPRGSYTTKHDGCIRIPAELRLVPLKYKRNLNVCAVVLDLIVLDRGLQFTDVH
jgi:hypothetical protein